MTEQVYQCTVCDHLYEPELYGPWENLPKYWNCPSCGAAKEEYTIIDL